MDRKKTIVAAVMINAGILTALFIAALVGSDEDSSSQEIVRRPSHPQPLYNDKPEVPLARQVAKDFPPAVQPVQLPQPITFSLPPQEVVEEKTIAFAPVEPSSSSVVPVPATVPKASVPAQTVSSVRSHISEIEVQKGDSLEKLAKKHQTTVDEIIKLNQLPSSFLRVGQKLKIPAEKIHEAPKPKVIASSPVESAEYYTMKVGDNPWSIAVKHHIKVDELLKLNGLNEKTARKLKPGDRLRIK